MSWTMQQMKDYLFKVTEGRTSPEDLEEAAEASAFISAQEDADRQGYERGRAEVGEEYRKRFFGGIDEPTPPPTEEYDEEGDIMTFEKLMEPQFKKDGE